MHGRERQRSRRNHDAGQRDGREVGFHGAVASDRIGDEGVTGQGADTRTGNRIDQVTNRRIQSETERLIGIHRGRAAGRDRARAGNHAGGHVEGRAVGRYIQLHRYHRLRRSRVVAGHAQIGVVDARCHAGSIEAHRNRIAAECSRRTGIGIHAQPRNVRGIGATATTAAAGFQGNIIQHEVGCFWATAIHDRVKAHGVAAAISVGADVNSDLLVSRSVGT